MAAIGWESRPMSRQGSGDKDNDERLQAHIREERVTLGKGRVDEVGLRLESPSSAEEMVYFVKFQGPFAQ